MLKRKCGSLEVSAIGMGCMGFSHGYGPGPDEKTAIELIRTAVSLGCTFFDTAEGYLRGQNEILVGKALKPCRAQVVLATKFQFAGDETAPLRQEIRAHLTASLKRLDTDYVDLYYYHRIHPRWPLEEVAEAVAPLIKEGLIRAWGVSQADAGQITRAQAVCPLAAVQNEYSMVERMYEAQVLPLTEKLGLGLVAFSPVGAGFLSGKTTSGDHYVGDDVRRAITRFKAENVRKNQPILDLLEAYAARHQATKAQIALAWLLHMGAHVLPIPGMRSLNRIKENLGAAELYLSPAEMAELTAKLNTLTVYGNRTDEDIIKMYQSDDSARPGALKPEH